MDLLGLLGELSNTGISDVVLLVVIPLLVRYWISEAKRELRDDINVRIKENNQHIFARFDAQDAKFEARFRALEARFDAQDARFDAQDARIDQLDSKNDSRAYDITMHLIDVRERLANIEGRMGVYPPRRGVEPPAPEAISGETEQR